ncbi:MAG: 50S ribosomal protein L10 [Defluviitaleaceae bacterium]|nr:50S ribosomal protein L10 [Defluviitaleaceae bacterium]
MPKIEQKQQIVNEIKEKLEKAVSVVLVDARGVTVEEDTILRKKFREAGVDYKVYKNTLLDFAVKDTAFEGLNAHLSGPTTVAFSYGDATVAAAIIAKESKDVKALEFKAGIVEGILYDAAGIEAIANIPPKEELLAKLLGSFKSPMSSFARVIDQIAQNKEQ